MKYKLLVMTFLLSIGAYSASAGEMGDFERAVSVGGLIGYDIPTYPNADGRLSWGAEVSRRFNKNWALGVSWTNSNGSKDEWDVDFMTTSAKLTHYCNIIPGMNYGLLYGHVFEDITRNITTGNATKKTTEEAEIMFGAFVGYEIFITNEISTGAFVDYQMVLGSPRTYVRYEGHAAVRYWFDI